MDKIIIVLALFLTASPAWTGGFKGMANEITKAAKKAGMERVAVLSFVPADGGSSNDGWNIAEKLTTQVVRAGQVRTVERALLAKLMEEHHLGRTGILEQATLKKLSKVFSVEGVITGSFVTLGSDVVIQVRLIDIETGVIVMASEGRTAREWSDSPAASWVPAPQFTVEASRLLEEDQTPLRDSLVEESCANAAERVDGMNKEILDLKARYWALQLKKGLPMSGFRHDPGSEISDPTLKREFYRRMKAWYSQGSIPKLTPYEVKRFVGIDSKAYSLYGRCSTRFVAAS